LLIFYSTTAFAALIFFNRSYRAQAMLAITAGVAGEPPQHRQLALCV
jgi:hypothetical protein